MKISISCIEKSHAFNLASELDKRNCLHRLITTFYSPKRRWIPEFRRDKELIDSNKVVTNVIPILMSRVPNKIPLIRNMDGWNYYADMAFDAWARTQVDKCDIFIAWSSAALFTLRKAKHYGVITVVERPVSHILHQKNLLEEEYHHLGIKCKPVDYRVLQKELVEYSEADYISIPSRYVERTFIEQGMNPKKLIRIPYGVDLSHFKPIPKEDNVFRVVFVGTLGIRKGLHYLLEAFSKMNLKCAELLLIGSLSPEIIPFLRKYEGHFKYIGRVQQLELYKYFSQGSVFVLPSIDEGLAMAQLQAMACGLPIICTTNTGGADVVRDTVDGYIIPIRSSEAIQEKLIYLYEHPDVCKLLGDSALKRVSGSFSWNHYGDKIIEEYNKILHSRRPYK